jgi:hypothetical protein
LYEPAPTLDVLYHVSVDGNYIGSSYAYLEDFDGEERLIFHINYHGGEPYVHYDPGDGWAAITADNKRHTVSIWTGGEDPTVQPPEEDYNSQVFGKHVYPGDTW